MDQERQAKRQQKLQGWFEEFDTNKDQKLQRDEFAQLLTHLHPEFPPSEEQLDKLCERATRIESSTLKLAGDKHGAIAWHSVLETVLCYGDYVREERFLNEIFAEFDADDSGTLDPSELAGLLRKCAPEGCAVDQADVDFVIQLCDVNANGLIDREEVKPMIARWKRLSAEKWEKQQEAEKRPRGLLRLVSAMQAGSPKPKSVSDIVSAARADGAQPASSTARALLAAARQSAATAEASTPQTPPSAPPARKPSFLRQMTSRRSMRGDVPGARPRWRLASLFFGAFGTRAPIKVAPTAA